MSSTRYSNDPNAFAPERNLAHASIQGINIGLNVIGRVARARTVEQRRAMVWLHNYARLMGITADALHADLGMPLVEIRQALTDPTAECIERFVAAVKRLRSTYEAGLPRLVKNRVSRAVRSGCLEAYQDKVFGIVVGPERIGKSEAFLDTYLRDYMDRAIIISCPEGRDMRSFIAALGIAVGIQPNSAKKNEVIREQILAVLASGCIEAIFIDEVQRIWPTDLQRQMPEKIEFLRTAWDAAELARRARRARDGSGGLSIIGCATPQFADDLNTAITENRRWKPGQFEGRMRRTYTPDTLTEHEVTEIARYMAPDFDADSIRALVSVALASPGLLGLLGNVIGKVKFIARDEARPITPDLISDAARRMLQGSITERRAKAKAAAIANTQPRLAA